MADIHPERVRLAHMKKVLINHIQWNQIVSFNPIMCYFECVGCHVFRYFLFATTSVYFFFSSQTSRWFEVVTMIILHHFEWKKCFSISAISIFYTHSCPVQGQSMHSFPMHWCFIKQIFLYIIGIATEPSIPFLTSFYSMKYSKQLNINPRLLLLQIRK